MTKNKKMQKYRRLFQLKNEKESKYQALLPPYESPFRHHVYFINEATNEADVDHLLDIARITNEFVVNTESTFKTNHPALLQIYYLQSVDIESPLLLIEMNHLPSRFSPLFEKFRQLINSIFRSSSTVFLWGSLNVELSQFVQFGLFSLPIPSIIRNTQNDFKYWFNQIMQKCQTTSSDDNDPININDVVIIDAPAYDPTLIMPSNLINERKILSKEPWSLQDSILYTFGKYLSKCDTLQNWSIGLDPRLPNDDLSFPSSHRAKLIQYVCLDCTSVAHLIFVMRQSQISLNNNDEQQQQQHRPTGQYSISKQQQILSNMFQLREDSSSSYEEYCTKLMTDHDLNDRCRRDSLTTHQTVIQPEPAPQSPQLVQHEPASSLITHSLIPRRKKKRSAASRNVVIKSQVYAIGKIAIIMNLFVELICLLSPLNEY